MAIKKHKESVRNITRACLNCTKVAWLVLLVTAALEIIKYGEIVHQTLVTIEVGVTMTLIAFTFVGVITVLFIEEYFE